jgi:hypothetical protein
MRAGIFDSVYWVTWAAHWESTASVMPKSLKSTSGEILIADDRLPSPTMI